jgi:hypothetical protein
MRGTLTQLLGAVALAGALSLSGCAQSEGERCEVDSDCSAGLTCDLRAGLNKGICSSGSGGVPLDAAVTPADGGSRDGSADLVVSSDVGAAPDQAASPDLSPDLGADLARDTQPDVTAPAPDASTGN